MRDGNRIRRAFTLVEVLVATTLLAVGIASVFSALAAVSKSQARAQETEHVQELAIRKLDELLATQQIQTDSLSGDFTDWGEDPIYQWTATTSTTGTTSLQTLTLTVQKQGGDNSTPAATIDTLYYQAPTSTGGTQ